MLIITSIITLPLGFIGFMIWPGTPDKPSKRFLTERDLELARSRLQRHGVTLTTHAFNFKLIGRNFQQLEDLLPHHLGCALLERVAKLIKRWISPLAKESPPILNFQTQQSRQHFSCSWNFLRPLHLLWLRSLSRPCRGNNTGPHLEPHWSHHYHSLEYSRIRPLVCFQHDIFVGGNVVSLVWLGA